MLPAVLTMAGRAFNAGDEERCLMRGDCSTAVTVDGTGMLETVTGKGWRELVTGELERGRMTRPWHSFQRRCVSWENSALETKSVFIRCCKPTRKDSSDSRILRARDNISLVCSFVCSSDSRTHCSISSLISEVAPRTCCSRETLSLFSCSCIVSWWATKDLRISPPVLCCSLKNCTICVCLASICAFACRSDSSSRLTVPI